MRDPLILCYHALSSRWDDGLAVLPQRFRWQMETLLRQGFTPATFARAVLDPPSGDVFAVTFDDAYRSVLELAFPVLERLGIPATVFVPTGYVDAGNASWPGVAHVLDGPHADELRVLSWADLAQLRDAGWEVGSHTRSHPHLPVVDTAQLDAELRDSRRDIEERLGVACESIAYPYGSTDAAVVRAAMAAGYRAGAALPERMHGPARMAWPRVGVYHHDDRLRFSLKRSKWVQRARTRSHEPFEPQRPSEAVPPHGERTECRVAVIVPCFNDGALLADAVASIAEPEPVEIVVVDDASTDPDTLAALQRLREEGVTVVRHEHNRGLPAARRTGLAATTAPYVYPLDADDLAVPWALTAMADRLDADPEAAACFADYAEFGTRRRVRRVPARLDAYRLAFRNDYPVSSLYRRRVIEPLGAWQAVGNGAGYEDWDLWMTLAERGHRAVHAGPGMLCVRRRLHGARMLGDASRVHRRLYADLRRRHPQLFAELPRHLRASDLPPALRVLYPIAFGPRPPLGLRTRAEELLARARGR